ncbi:hypothetical protein KR032_002211, partial [Drosophila birchii]
LNKNSVPDAYPLPRIHQILERLRNTKFILTLDLKNGYWQIPVAKEGRECTVIGPDIKPHAFTYLDDIIVIGSTLEEHVANLREVIRRLHQANLRLNIHYRRGAQNLVADALLRQPLPVVQQAQVQGINCKWLTKMLEKFRTEPAKFPDYREKTGQLYRCIGLRPQEEEYSLWKLRVGADYRHRVLQENHDIPTA